MRLIRLMLTGRVSSVLVIDDKSISDLNIVRLSSSEVEAGSARSDFNYLTLSVINLLWFFRTSSFVVGFG